MTDEMPGNVESILRSFGADTSGGNPAYYYRRVVGNERDGKVTYESNSSGIGEMLNSHRIFDAHFWRIGEEIKNRAITYAMADIYSMPEDPKKATWRRGHKRTGRYLESFEVDVRYNTGAKRDRIGVVISNYSPSALWVELGHRGREPYHVLARAARATIKGTG